MKAHCRGREEVLWVPAVVGYVCLRHFYLGKYAQYLSQPDSGPDSASVVTQILNEFPDT